MPSLSPPAAPTIASTDLWKMLYAFFFPSKTLDWKQKQIQDSILTTINK